jgi:hypothetical protein
VLKDQLKDNLWNQVEHIGHTRKREIKIIKLVGAKEVWEKGHQHHKMHSTIQH